MSSNQQKQAGSLAPRRIHVLTISHSSGMSSWAETTEPAAKARLAEWVAKWWDSEITSESMPDDPEEAIDRYFELVEEQANIEEVDAPLSPREREHSELASIMLSMLTDLENCHGWDELTTTMDEVRERAASLGIELEG